MKTEEEKNLMFRRKERKKTRMQSEGDSCDCRIAAARTKRSQAPGTMILLTVMGSLLDGKPRSLNSRRG